MRRVLEGLTRFALRRDFIHMLYQGLGVSFRIRQFPFSLRCRCMAPIYMQLHNYFVGVRDFCVSRIPQGGRLAGRELLRGLKGCGGGIRVRLEFINPSESSVAH